MKHLLLFITLVTGPILALCENEPLVRTPLGSVKGKVYTSRHKSNFFAFRGIRYAEPPVENLRFKPPVPVKPWSDTFDATKDGPACIQGAWDGMTSEDCLCLNVYTHFVDSNAMNSVLVFIHGGEFEYFTSQSEWLGPEYLMDRHLVVVTINYRLGVLGFLSTGDEHAPGNYGMKDQVEALKWVRNNIRAFGGDPDRVTIAGFEAGAASVTFHMLSPMSRGLFHGAIVMSASALNNWTITRDPLSLAKEIADSLNCPTDNSQIMIDCIRKVPVRDIIRATRELYMKLWDERMDPFAIMTPVIESGNDDEEKFLPKDPLQLLQDGDIADVPLIIGTTRDETAYKARILLYNQQHYFNMSVDWNDFAPGAFYYNQNDEISQMIREFYLGGPDVPISGNVSDGLEHLYADSLIIFGVIRFAKLVSDKNTQPVYLYQYNYERKLPVHGTSEIYRGLISSSDDTTIIIRPRLMAPIDESKKDSLCADKMIRLWADFMDVWNPTPEAFILMDNVVWPQFKTNDPYYLDINETLTVVKGIYYADRMAFWENLFPL